MRICLLALSMLLAASAVAGELPVAPNGPAEAAMLGDVEDGRLDDMNLLQAGLVASGLAQPADLAGFQPKLDALLAGARAAAGEGGSDVDRARKVFDFLHGRILKKYEFHAVDLVGLLNDGRYNCVSATLVYNGLLAELGIPSRAILVPSHVYSQVGSGAAAVEVETTSPKGFAPARTLDAYRDFLKSRKLQAEAWSIQGGKRVKNKALIHEIQGKRQTIGSLVLVALVYSNIGVARLRDRDLEGALAAFGKAAKVAGDNPRFLASRDGMIRNLAFELASTGAYRDAVAFMDRCRKIDRVSKELTARLDELTRYAYHKWGISQVDAGRYGAARKTLLSGLKRFPGDEILTNNLEVAHSRWLASLIKAGKYSEAIELAPKAMADFPSPPRTLAHNYAVAVQREVSRLQKEAGQKAEGLALAKSAWSSAGKLPAAARSLLRFQVAIATFRTGDYPTAAALFKAGMEASPKDKLWAKNFGSSLVNWAATAQDKTSAELLNALLEGVALVPSDTAVKNALWGVVLRKAKALSPKKGVALINQTAGMGLPPDHGMLRSYYVVLSALNAKAGNKPACRAAAEKGLQTFPDDKGLKNNLEYCR